jgi:hypothetical protein
MSILRPLMWYTRLASSSYRHSQILWPLVRNRPTLWFARFRGARQYRTCSHSLTWPRGGFSMGKIKVDHDSFSCRRFRYFLSRHLPPASRTSDTNRTCWWHLNLFIFRSSSELVTPASITAFINHLSPSLGGLMGRGAISIVMLNLSTFSQMDFNQVFVAHLPWVANCSWNGWGDRPSSVSKISVETCICMPTPERHP